MSWRRLKIIVWKDLLEVSKNKTVISSMIIVPLIFILLLPGIILGISFVTGSTEMYNDPDFKLMLEKIPPEMLAGFAGLDEAQSMITMMLGYLFAPFFLIMPLMLSISVAAESFAGERERKTIEALLYTPATDAELFFGKALAGFIPAYAISVISFVLYALVLNLGGYPIFGRIWFPLDFWYVLVFWVCPAVAALGIGATVLISTRAQSFMDAYQTGGVLVVLVVGMFAAQAAGLVYLNIWLGVVLGFIFWLAAGLLFFFGIQQFNRRALMTTKAR